MKQLLQMSRRFGLLMFAVFVIAMCNSSYSQTKTESDRESIVRAFVGKFNRHEADQMLEMVADDFQWVYITDGKAAVHLEGKPALKREMERYFARCASCKSKLQWVQSSGSRITALEEASWTTKDGPKSQRSLSIYEFKDDRIARVFYFPVEPK